MTTTEAVQKIEALGAMVWAEGIKWAHGGKVNRAKIRRWQAEQRAIAIAALGWAAEGKDRYTECYAATTGEIIGWAREGVR